jgi:hypothetical protein
MSRNWIRESQFVPSLWLAPLAADKKGCEAAKGRYVEGVIHGYEKKPNKKGVGDLHFYRMIVESSNMTEAMVWDAQTAAYREVPFQPNEMYSIKASGLLHFLLAKFMSREVNVGRPVRIMYDGTKPFQTKDAGGNEITANSHQWTLDHDADYIPQIAPVEPQAQIAGPEAEEPLPPFEDER